MSAADTTDPTPARPDRSRRRLAALLRERNQCLADPTGAARVADIDRTIRDTFERRLAILALDMCGFSRLTASHGILFFLSMIVQMEDAARPAVANNGGHVFKQDADNLFAVFPTPAQAVEGALDIFLAFQAVNNVVPGERDIQGSVGIGYGDLLVLEGPGGDVEDVFGHEMNAGSRLGEDVASGSEILLTPAAATALPPGMYQLEEKTEEYRGTAVHFHRYAGRAADGTS